MTITELLAKIDGNRNTIDARRPLTVGELRELDSYFKIGTTYSSNALEGNSLTLTETKIIIEDGITIGGKPLREVYETTGHAKAFDFMLSAARSDSAAITEDAICELHRLFYGSIDGETAGLYRSRRVFISGTDYVPPKLDDVPALMSAFVNELAERQCAAHPVLLSAFAHRRLVDIHPFEDGNGRTARLLMNLLLVRSGYCIVSIPPVLRREYIQALIAAQRTEKPTTEPFDTLIAECELEAQKDYLRLLGNEKIASNTISTERTSTQTKPQRKSRDER
jgi:Fic family protein